MIPPLVSILVPAWNAARYIRRTLASAAAQTYPHIEIVVTDDGSTDNTGELVIEFARGDPRVRLVRQGNLGVAAARNLTIRAARGELVAPLDADDLWAPDKIEKQVAALAAAGPDCGLVYCYYRLIDDDDRVIMSFRRSCRTGWVFLQHIQHNFIGNGSSILMRRSVVQEMGGYSSRLRREGVEGCEDFFLQLAIASRYRFAVVPEYLVGYRKTPNNMSSDAIRMMRSRQAVLASFLARSRREVWPVIAGAFARSDVELFRLGLNRGLFRTALSALGRITVRSPCYLANIASVITSAAGRRLADGAIRSLILQPLSGRTFDQLDSADEAGIIADTRLIEPDWEAVRLDEALGPVHGYLAGAPERGTLNKMPENPAAMTPPV